jgi:putative endonuclease
MPTFFIYIMSSRSRVLYTGVTRDLCRRVQEHKHPVRDCFTSRYKVNRLVYFETAMSPWAAIAREKVIKTMTREGRIQLIERDNPGWEDLAAGWRI